MESALRDLATTESRFEGNPLSNLRHAIGIVMILRPLQVLKGDLLWNSTTKFVHVYDRLELLSSSLAALSVQNTMAPWYLQGLALFKHVQSHMRLLRPFERGRSVIKRSLLVNATWARRSACVRARLKAVEGFLCSVSCTRLMSTWSLWPVPRIIWTYVALILIVSERMHSDRAANFQAESPFFQA